MTQSKKVILAVIVIGLTVFLLLSGPIVSIIHRNTVSKLVIFGPKTVSPGDIIEYTADIPNKSLFLQDVVYQWNVLDINGPVNFRSVSNKNIIFPAGINSDKYTVVCSVVTHYNYFVRSYVEPAGIFSSNTVVNSGPIPPGPIPPGPIPPPPNPTPTPIVTEHLYAVAIFDMANNNALPPSQLAIHNSQTIFAALGALQCHWLERDKAAPEISSAAWQKIVSQYGTPCLIITNDTGSTTYFKGTLPPDENGIVNRVKLLRGN